MRPDTGVGHAQPRRCNVKRVVAFPLQAGGTVLVEVDEPEEKGGTVRAGRADDLVGHLLRKLPLAPLE
jgi:hypothetical protein